MNIYAGIKLFVSLGQFEWHFVVMSSIAALHPMYTNSLTPWRQWSPVTDFGHSCKKLIQQNGLKVYQYPGKTGSSECGSREYLPQLSQARAFFHCTRLSWPSIHVWDQTVSNKRNFAYTCRSTYTGLGLGHLDDRTDCLW